MSRQRGRAAWWVLTVALVGVALSGGAGVG
jgi:hypothetical protein